MFDDYPKKRPNFPGSYSLIYKNFYKGNRQGKSLASFFARKVDSWLHKKIASDISHHHNKKTLKLCAGTLNQLINEEPNHYDIVELFNELYIDSPCFDKITSIYNDISDISIVARYDRIISI